MKSDAEIMLDMLDETANMMRGMILDPQIPEHARNALMVRVQLLENLVTEYYVKIPSK